MHGGISAEKNHCWFVIFIILHANGEPENDDRSRWEDLMASLDTLRINRPGKKVVVGHVEIITLLLILSYLNILSLAYFIVIMNFYFVIFYFCLFWFVFSAFCLCNFVTFWHLEMEGLPSVCFRLK